MAMTVKAPMVGTIVSVSVKAGDRVEVKDQVAALESMKIVTPILAPVSGIVKEVFVSAGQEVKRDAPIAIIE